MYIDGTTIPVFEVAITFQKCWKSFLFDPLNTLFTTETLFRGQVKKKECKRKLPVRTIKPYSMHP